MSDQRPAWTLLCCAANIRNIFRITRNPGLLTCGICRRRQPIRNSEADELEVVDRPVRTLPSLTTRPQQPSETSQVPPVLAEAQTSPRPQPLQRSQTWPLTRPENYQLVQIPIQITDSATLHNMVQRFQEAQQQRARVEAEDAAAAATSRLQPGHFQGRRLPTIAEVSQEGSAVARRSSGASSNGLHEE